MRHRLSVMHVFLFFILLVSHSVFANEARLLENYGNIPLSFTENNGQYDPEVKFTTNGSGCTMYFTVSGTTYLLSRETEESLARRAAQRSVVYVGDLTDDLRADRDYESFAIKLNFLNANPEPSVIGDDLHPGKSNYFIGGDNSQWRTDVANYGKVRLNDLYDGIDLVYYGNRKRVKYDFVVQPGIDPSQIRLEYELGDSAEKSELSINEKGELVVSTSLGDVIERQPYAYQIIDGREVEVAVSYLLLEGTGRFTFRVGTYDSRYELVIDPELIYSTYIGGSNLDQSVDFEVDSSGNVYIVGITNSSNYPTTSGVIDTSANGSYDINVTKLNSTGTALVFSTYLGGSSEDNGIAIDIDSSGNVYIAGWTSSSNYPTTSGAYDESINGNFDILVTKLNATGTAIIFSTFVGGSNRERGYEINVDSSGNSYVSGLVESSNYPTTAGAYDESYNGNFDCFIFKLNSTGTDLVYSTFLGGSAHEYAINSKIDSVGNVYLSHWTSSSNFPTTSGAYDESHNGNYDVFVSKIDPSGSSLIYSTFIGGSGQEEANSIFLDSSGKVYIASRVYTSDFPITAGAYDASHNGGIDIAVSKLNETGSVLEYSTFLGGSGADYGNSLYVDSTGSAFISGSTGSGDFPTTADAFDSSMSTSYDGFFGKLNATGTVLEYSSFIGGNGTPDAPKIIADSSGNVYLGGITASSDFPTTAGAYDTTHNGGQDAYVAKFSFASTPTVALTSPNGAESYEASTSQNITWSSTGVTNVKLEYSTNYGTDWTQIVASTSANAGSYAWTVPIRPSVNCLVRVSDASDTGVTDMSNAAFTITENTGNTVLFVSYRDGNSEIYVMNPDGSNQTNLTNDPANDHFASWSPDGTKIVIASVRSGVYDIYRMDADGSNLTNISNRTGSEYDPVYSPDGTKIMYYSDVDGDGGIDIYIMNTDGSNVINITNNSFSDEAPIWSPDGLQIAFVSNRDGNKEIYTMNADGSNSIRLTNNGTIDSNPSLSPDGSKICFYSKRDGNDEIYVMNFDGSNQTRLTNDSSRDLGSSWSPDGTKIAFRTMRNGDNLYVMNADGSNPVQLTTNSDYSPSWARPVYVAPTPTVTLTAPYGGASYESSTSQNITWNASSVTNVKLEYSTNNGTDWTQIVASTSANAGSYAWTVPIRPSVNCLVRVSDASNTSVADTSDAAFTITESSGETILFMSDNDQEIYVMNLDGTNQTQLTNNSTHDQSPHWSPDGTKIVFSSYRDGDAGDIYKMDADGSNQTRLTSYQQGTSEPSWSPDNSKIVFRSGKDGNYEIYVMNTDGSNVTRLTNNSTSEGRPHWSPDGSKIVFTSNRDGNSEIYVMNSDGSNQTRITNNSSNDGAPVWSPDGSTIGFYSARDGDYEIYSMTADGSNQTRLTTDSAADYYFTWSPDGSKIVFMSDRSGNQELYVMNADGSNQVRLTNNSVTDIDPSWARPVYQEITSLTLTVPNGSESYEASTSQNITWSATGVTNVKLEYTTDNGTDWTDIITSTAANAGSYAWTVPIRPSVNCKIRISDASDAGVTDVSDAAFGIVYGSIQPIYFYSDRDTNWEIYAINPDGSNLTRVTNNSSLEMYPSVSPDGTKIVFTSARTGNWEIFVMNVDGSEQTQITNLSSSSTCPKWSYDGAKIYFHSGTSTRYVYSINSDGTNQVKMTEGTSSATPHLSPDGSKIVYTYGESGSESIYVMNADGFNNQQLTANTSVENVPQWSPDGSKIAFTSSRDGNTEIYVMNADGSNQTRLTNNPSEDYYPSWSPDGSQITFRSMKDGNGEIYVMNADGSNQIRLTSNTALDNVPSWARPVYVAATPVVSLTAPNGGASYEASTSQNITWTHTAVTNVKLEYSTNNGTDWTEIVASTAASAGSYAWTVPIRPSVNCKVRVSDASDASVTDMSDAAFTITEPAAPIMVSISGGTFQMGSTGGEADEEPVHTVTVSSFEISAHEITNVQYAVYLNEALTSNIITTTSSLITGSSGFWSGQKYMYLDGSGVDPDNDSKIVYNEIGQIFSVKPGYENWPATWVTWYGSKAYAEYYGYDLPTEAEWEYAARGGMQYEYGTDDGTINTSKANYRNTGIMHPVDVGSYPANPFGLYDMCGNLYEWCNDWYGSYSSESTVNPIGSLSGTSRVLRDGAWNVTLGGQYLRTSDRGSGVPTGGHYKYGFRVVKRAAKILTLTAPNGGESYEASTTQNITWSATGVTNVKLEYSTNNGTTWTPITASTAASTGSYSWTTPNIQSSECLFKITSSTDGSIVDQSDAVFTIYQTLPTMVAIPNGSFQMGQTGIAEPVHTVTIEVNGFKMSATEITQGQYEAIIGSNPSNFTGDNNLPVEMVSWYDAVTFCNTLSTNQGLEPCYNLTTWECDFTKNGYRLPTEAEREYACRAGTSTNYNTGDNENDLALAGWYGSNSGSKTHPVGQKTENTFGLYDMHGNVWEWCNEWLGDYTSESVYNPTGALTGTSRVKRGGSWFYPADRCLTAYRSSGFPVDGKNDIGFRVARGTFSTASVALTAPNGSENWASSYLQTVTWTANDVTNVKLEYSTNNGTTWTTIIASTAASAGSYPWTTPNIQSSECLVKITSTADGSLVDKSNEIFTIYQTKPTMVDISGGTFEMGSTSGNADEQPVHTVTISSFEMSTTEITQGQYIEIIGSNPSSYTGSLSLPVEDADWQDVVTFCNTLSTAEGLQPCYNLSTWECDFTKNGYRLPTEAEWEYASKGGSNYEYGTDNGSLSTSKANYSGNVGNPVSVGSYPANPYGLYDISGNVWEWCNDWYGNYSETNATNPTGPTTGQYRVKRGGGWQGADYYCRSSRRGSDAPSGAYYGGTIGFRVVRGPLSSVTVTAPNGDEEWASKSTQDITWTSSGIPTVKLEYSLDDGTNWEMIDMSYSASLGTYAWAVPDTVSTLCLVRVSSASNTAINDVSDDAFKISRPSVTVVAPNGGEKWKAGEERSITWTSKQVENVTIEYSADNGATYKDIAASVSAALLTYAWTVPDTSSAEALVRISDVLKSETTDKSDAEFSLLNTRIVLASPEGGETWSVGTEHTIMWTSQDVDLVKIEYSIDEGTTWLPILPSIDASLGSYGWTIPDNETELGVVRISNIVDPKVKAVCELPFSIKKTTITVKSPSGSEDIRIGQDYEIQWSAPMSETLKIEFSANDGANWTTIESSVSAADSVYVWTVPDIESEICLIRLTDTTNPMLKSQSDAVFTIGVPTLTLVSPIGGENLQNGTIFDIEWDSSIIANLLLELSIDNGETWSSIIDSTKAPSGAYEWTVPSTLSDSCLVRATDLIDNTIIVTSDSIFRISEPSITVTAPNGDEVWQVGMNVDITWVSDFIDKVKIEMSIDGGFTWNVLKSSIDAAAGLYSVLIPNTPSQYCVVKISALSDESIDDRSDEAFTIVKDLLSIITPNGGERWKLGTEQDIEWDAASNITSVDISYSDDGGVNWMSVVSGYGAALGSYMWTVPETVSKMSLVRITDALDEDLKVQSREPFSIIDPEITVLTPAEDDEWKMSGTYEITWESVDVISVSIDYSKNGGATWTAVEDSVEAELGVYEWTLPDKSAPKSLIRLTDYDDDEVTAESEEFSVVKPMLTLTGFQAGRTWVAGTIQNIRWQSKYIEFITVSCSYDDGETWDIIAEDAPAEEGAYMWMLPEYSVESCLIRLEDAENDTVSDESQKGFTIVSSTGAITGIVTDSLSGDAVPDVQVALSREFMTVTDEDGAYELLAIEPGEYTLKMWKTGYIDVIEELLSVNAGDVLEMDMAMMPKSGPVVTELTVSPDPTSGSGVITVEGMVQTNMAAKIAPFSKVSTMDYGNDSGAAKAARKQAIEVSNIFIKAQVEENGSVAIWTNDNKRLVDTNGDVTMIRIDSTSYEFGGSAGSWTTPLYATLNQVRGIWTTGDIEVVYTLGIGLGTTTRRFDSFKMTYEIRNTGSTAHDVGLFRGIDVMVKSKDNAIVNAGGFDRTERSFSGDEVPSFWQAYEDKPDKKGKNIVVQGTMQGMSTVSPDRLAVADWSKLRDVTWDYSISGSYNDTGVGLWWNPVSVESDGSRRISTMYGLGALDTVVGEVSMSVAADKTLSVINNEVTPNPMQVTALVTNRRGISITGVELAMELPPGLVLAAGESAVKTIGTLSNGETKQAVWRIVVEPYGENQTYAYSITCSSQSGQLATTIIRNSVLVPAVMTGLYVRGAELYFDDDDPGENNGIAMQATDELFNEPTEGIKKTVSISNLTEGQHTVHVRGRDSEGDWGDVTVYEFTVNEPAETIISVYPEAENRAYGGRILKIPVMLDMGESEDSAGSFQAFVTWPTDMFAFVNVSAGTGVGGGVSRGPIVTNTDNTDNGELAISYINTKGLDDTSTMFILMFRVIGAGGQQGEVAINMTALSATTTFRNLLPYTTVENYPFTIIDTSIWGDVDSNESVQTRDAFIIMTYAVGRDVSAYRSYILQRGDVNSDGSINSADALICKSYHIDPDNPNLPVRVGQPVGSVPKIAAFSPSGGYEVLPQVLMTPMGAGDYTVTASIDAADTGYLIGAADAVISWDPGAYRFLSIDESLEDMAVNTDRAAEGEIRISRISLAGESVFTMPQITMKSLGSGGTVAMTVVQATSTESFVSLVRDVDASDGQSDTVARPMPLVLMQNVPNPFNPTTHISYELQDASNVRVDIFNIQGQHINTIAEGFESAGMHTVVWDATDKTGSTVSTGIYIYRVQTPYGRLQKQMLLLR